MRALWLDYQAVEPGRRRNGLILLATGVLLTGLLLARYFSVADDVAAAELQLSGLQQAAPAEGVQAERQTTAQWEALFQALEAAGDESVTLLSLQSGKEGILMTGEARSLDASMAYVTRLQMTPLLADVHMTESAVVSDHPQRPVRFSLVAGEQGGLP